MSVISKLVAEIETKEAKFYAALQPLFTALSANRSEQKLPLRRGKVESLYSQECVNENARDKKCPKVLELRTKKAFSPVISALWEL